MASVFYFWFQLDVLFQNESDETSREKSGSYVSFLSQRENGSALEELANTSCHLLT